MARNAKFYRKYTIEVKGISSNDFMGKLIDKMLKGLMRSIAVGYKQITVTKFEIKRDDK